MSLPLAIGFIGHCGHRNRQAAPKAARMAIGYTIVDPTGKQQLPCVRGEVGFAAPRAGGMAFGHTIVNPNGNRNSRVGKENIVSRNYAFATCFIRYWGRRNRQAAPRSAGWALGHTIASPNENRGYSCCTNYRAAAPQNGKVLFPLSSVVNYVCRKLVRITEKKWNVFSVKY